MKIKIKYHADIEPLTYIGGGKSNWIDLRAAETVFIPVGEYRLISLGVSMERQPDFQFIQVDELGNADRGGIGSTGKR